MPKAPGLRDEAAEPLRMEKYCADLFTRVLVPTDFSLPEEAAISFLKSIPGMGEIHLLMWSLEASPKRRLTLL